MPKKTNSWKVIWCHRAVVIGTSKTEAKQAAERRHAAAQIAGVERVEDSSVIGLFAGSDEVIGVVEPEQGYDVSLTRREIQTIAKALRFYSEHPEAPQIERPLSSVPREDEPSEIDNLIDKIEDGIPPGWTE